MKLSSKLILSFSFVALLLAGLGVFSQYYNQQVKDQVVAKSEEALMALEYSGEMGLGLYRSLLNAQYLLDDRYRQGIQIDTSNTSQNGDAVIREIRLSLDNFSQNMGSLREIVYNFGTDGMVNLSTHDELIGIMDQIESRFNIYRSLVEQLFQLSSVDFEDGREFLNVTVEPYFRNNLIPLVERLRENSGSKLDQEIELLNARLEYVGLILALGTLIAFALSIGLAFYLYKSIATPLSELEETAKKIGGGDLDERIRIDSEDEIGGLANEFNKMAENLSKTTFSKDYVDNIIESMAEALIVTDEHARIKKVNSAAGTLLGYSEREMLDMPINHIFPNGTAEKINLMNKESLFENFETQYLNKGGDVIPVNFSRSLMRNPDGSVKGLVCVASDITERKQAEHQIKKSLQEKEILLAEIHHRVKNNLAVISGLLQMQMWEAKNEVAEMVLRDSQLRVQSIALVHEKLYQSENLSSIEFDKYLRDLLQAISSTYVEDSRNITIRTDLEPIGMNINQAIPCSLLINELVVNSYKHAFEGKSEGIICISMTQQDGFISIKVRDDGKGFPDGFSYKTSNNLGLTIVNTLLEQLKAEVKTYNDNGAVFEIGFEQEETL